MEIYHTDVDFTTSVYKALEEIDSNYKDYPGLIIAGSHAPSMIGDKLEKIREARENNIPFLGICLGMHLMIIEYARNVVKLKGANSTEIDEGTPHPVVVKMDKLRVGMQEGESYWHHYQFNKDYEDGLIGLKFAYKEEIADMARIRGHKYFVGVQYHPEYQSSKDKPHPVLQTFLGVCKHA